MWLSRSASWIRVDVVIFELIEQRRGTTLYVSTCSHQRYGWAVQQLVSEGSVFSDARCSQWFASQANLFVKRFLIWYYIACFGVT